MDSPAEFLGIPVDARSSALLHAHNLVTRNFHILPQTRAEVRIVAVGAGEAGQRLDNFLLKRLPGVPKSHVYRLLRSGQVRVNGGRSKPSRKLELEDQVRIPPVRTAERPNQARPPDDLQRRLEAALIHEDSSFLAFNKPAGLAVHGGSGVLFGVIEVARAWDRHEFLELAHRIDRETSGVLLLAKSRPALLHAQQAFRDGHTRKFYLALLDGVWKGGPKDVHLALSRDHEQGGERRVQADAEGRAAHSRFEPLERFADSTLVRVQIFSGRMHQIRVHAQSLGMPLAGDAKYGDAQRNQAWRRRGLKRMFLHAQQLQLNAAPGFDDLHLQAPLASELEQVLTTLRGQNS